jgi:hypothetical protein
MTNKTKTIQRNWQHRVQRAMKNKTKTIQRNWQHRVQRAMKNKTKTQHNMCWTPLCANKHKQYKQDMSSPTNNWR